MDPALLDRFSTDLDTLIGPDRRLGVAVSGGPDSLALLLLAAAARPGKVEAATVDHGLRPESRAEAEMVAGICRRLSVPHAILTVEWEEVPRSAIQERARHERYGLLGAWLRERRLDALLTGHHLDDQVETLLMRLNRGSGVGGLAGMRPISDLPVDDRGPKLLRPLLGWRRTELEQVCAAVGLQPLADPSNRDESFERVRVRQALSEAHWLDPKSVARSAANLAAADEALDWATMNEWKANVRHSADCVRYRPSDAPAEIRRRIVRMVVGLLAQEGPLEEPRGRELDRLLGDLEAGGTSTFRGIKCSGGTQWSFEPAPPRR